MEEVSKQYNNFSKTYSENRKIDEVGNKRFYEILSSIELRGKKLLDIGCGDGFDLEKFKKMGATSFGIDSSKELVRLASERLPDISITIGKSEELPFLNESFDVVVSKYALQTSPYVPKILDEVGRVLKPGGYFIFLTKHPIRQFLEKIETYKDKENIDYFDRNIVDSLIFDGKVHLREPSHALAEYFSEDVLSKFDLMNFIEDYDFPASEQLHGYVYPTFFVAKFRRR